MRKVETEGETGEERIVCALLNSWLPPCIAATFPTLLARYMRSNVYVTAGCPVDRQQQRRRAAGLLLSARRSIDRQLARSVANAGSVMS